MATEQKPIYVLLTIDTLDTPKAQRWFQRAKHDLDIEELFIGDMKVTPSVNQAIGFLVLFKVRSADRLRSTLCRLKNAAADQHKWECNFMKADWIDEDWLATPKKAQPEDTWRMVGTDGRIHFHGQRYFVTHTLRGERINVRLERGKLKVYHQGSLLKTFQLSGENTSSQ